MPPKADILTLLLVGLVFQHAFDCVPYLIHFDKLGPASVYG